jgi:hypothetical protein
VPTIVVSRRANEVIVGEPTERRIDDFITSSVQTTNTADDMPIYTTFFPGTYCWIEQSINHQSSSLDYYKI